MNRFARLRTVTRAYFLRVWQGRSRDIGADIAMMPPDRKTCPTGGSVYRQGLLSFRLGMAGGAFRSPPIPASPEDLAWYVTHPATYSVKADGVTYEGSLPAAYPPLADVSVLRGESTVRAEEMVVETNRGPRTLYLVFDIVGPPYHTDTLCERMGVLRRAHRHAPASPSYAEDSNALSVFLRHLPEDCARRIWWPKWVGLLGPDPAASLRLLSEQPKTSYKNDGWILTPHAEHCVLLGGGRFPPDVKVKPPHEMTADLSVNGQVWRCTWEGKGWEPREARPEKRNPNPPEIVAALETFHRNPWSPVALEPYIRNAHYRTTRGTLSAPTGWFLRTQRSLQATRLATVCTGARVLDIGSGRGRVARQVYRLPRARQPASWVGLDTDPVTVEEARLHPETQAHTWLWCDAATLAHPLTGECPPQLRAPAYDVIALIHSIHHAAADEKTWQAWSRNLTALAAPGCTLVIATIDPARLPASAIELPDKSYVRPVGAHGAARTSAYRVSLAWANSATSPVTEHYFALDRLTDDLAALGWELATLMRGPEAEKWDAWADAHVWLVFRRA